jgi:transposase
MLALECIIGRMYVATVPNRDSPPAILLRESYREGDKVKTRTVANLTSWPHPKIEALRAVLKGATSQAPLDRAFDILRSRPHGHVAAVLSTLKRSGLETLIAPRRSRERDLVSAMLAARIIAPRPKLALARDLSAQTCTSTLGEILGLERASSDELYEAMDWLLLRQHAIEDSLAKKHLHEGTLVLYDVTSTYFEGRHCPLARLGHSRDGKHDKLQIVFGLLTDAEGCPVAVEVFAGNTGDPKTLPSQIQKLRQRFGLTHVVLVGDRGMITSARIEQDLKKSPGIEWITALRGPAIRKLVASSAIQLSLFDERDLVEISSADYPGERLIVCKNPLLAEERKRKREELLKATERELTKIAAAVSRPKSKLRGEGKIALRVGKVLGRYKVGKHFRLSIGNSSFHYERNQAAIDAEAMLDGLYVIRTRLPQQALAAEQTVLAYKRLAAVERAFRSLKTVDLKVRPIHHRLAERVRAHVFLCMLAYYVEWHMRRRLAPLLFDDDDKQEAQALRTSVVAKAQRSTRALAKAYDKITADGWPVHSFQTLLADLATIVKNRVQPKTPDLPAFDMITTPTRLQTKILRLLNVQL